TLNYGPLHLMRLNTILRFFFLLALCNCMNYSQAEDGTRNGKCPENNVFGICIVNQNSCFRDKDCNPPFICCSIGCGKECVKPANE
ncbi:hypothetical protein B4U79_18723, partial [Dinothrombium tinctorium]